MKGSWIIGHVFSGGTLTGINPRLISAIAKRRITKMLSPGYIVAAWVLDYAVDDSGLCRVRKANGAWYAREPGTAHLYAPGTRVWEDSRMTTGGFESRYVVFTGGQLAGLDEFVQNSRGFGRFQDPAGLLGERLRQIALAVQDGGAGAFWHAQGQLADLFALLLRQTHPVAGSNFVRVIAEAPTDGIMGVVEQAEQWLSVHYRDAFSLAALAARLKVSPTTLTHRYKRLTGESPVQALLAIRVSHAKELLLRGHSLKQIAAETGFYDPFHLSRVFKKKTGLSPRQYLKRHGA